MRTAIELFVNVPEHVYVLRGQPRVLRRCTTAAIIGGVSPAEAIDDLKPHVPLEVFARVQAPVRGDAATCSVRSHLFVHAGIPRDELIQQRWRDLSSLNDAEIRFQMMWSDPSERRLHPARAAEQTARFPFGRRSSSELHGAARHHTMIRGHEKIDDGFRKIYDDGRLLLLNLFSAGGTHNADLPPNSSYRGVTPMALTDPPLGWALHRHAVGDRLPALQRPDEERVLQTARGDRIPRGVMTKTLRIRIRRPAQECFRAFCDAASFPRWVPGITRCEVLRTTKEDLPTEINFEAAIGAYTLLYFYDAPRLRVGWMPGDQALRGLRGFAAFRPDGESECEMSYALELETDRGDEPLTHAQGTLDRFRKWVEQS